MVRRFEGMWRYFGSRVGMGRKALRWGTGGMSVRVKWKGRELKKI